jgi:hypothetical protein
MAERPRSLQKGGDDVGISDSLGERKSETPDVVSYIIEC